MIKSINTFVATSTMFAELAYLKKKTIFFLISHKKEHNVTLITTLLVVMYVNEDWTNSRF